MRVLLLHEMSGVHTELSRALAKLGLEVDVATYGDGFKRYPTDVDIGRATPGVFSSLARASKQFGLARSFHKYDVIQTISPAPFHRAITGALEKRAAESGARLIYVAAGSDAIYRKHVTSLEYWPPHDWFDRPRDYSRLVTMLKSYSHIVPVCWEYRYAMRKAGQSPADAIPFPIDVTQHRAEVIGTGGKLKLLHPLNRTNLNYDFKGTKIIQAAFDILERKYPQDVECISVGGLAHWEYDKLVDEVDVIVDQVFSYSYGMSAAYGLAKGKVVLSGMEGVVKEKGHYRECPVINVVPTAQSVVEAVEGLLGMRSAVRSLGEAGRAFAEKWHDYMAVGCQYLDIYQGDQPG